jgi:hypothetical protein
MPVKVCIELNYNGGNEMYYGFVKEIKVFVEKDPSLVGIFKKALDKIIERKNGKIYSINEHMNAIIYSLLSNQRPWQHIEENRNKIDKIFFDFDKERLRKTEASYFVESLKEIHCANRSINRQMNGLKDIIDVLDRILERYGKIDDFYNNHPKVKEGYPYYLVKELADRKNKYKLKNMGIALVCEYFKNIGIDIAKPDTHIMRMLGKNILGFSKNTLAAPEEAIKYIKEIADKNCTSQMEVDALLWLYCADGYGEICTKDNPKCFKCIIKSYCNKSKINAA